MVLRRREAQAERASLSKRICATLKRLAEYREAKTICSYVGVGSEVETWDLLREAIAGDQRVVVPYVDGNRLALLYLHDLAELAPAAFGLLEPRPELRGRPARQVHPADVELFVVPGLAFDVTGTRLGYGKGYYDRLLCLARVETPCTGLAFTCQMVPKLPVLEYDIRMHTVITEEAVHRSERRRPDSVR